MNQYEMEIITGNREIAQKLIECGNLQNHFELCGVKYLVTGISREIGASSVAISATLRQIPASEWRGPEDGLPPVGLEVECSVMGMDWSLCTVLAYGKNKTFYRRSDGHEWACASGDIRFRSAIAERERGIARLVELMDGAGYRSAAERLYNAGVRAPEVK